MSIKITPMIHVSDVRATAEWYQSIGFELTGTFGCGGGEGDLSWAKLTYGGSDIMLNIGGKPSDDDRREFDLYIQTDDAAKLFAELKGKTEIVEELHDTEYGMREFIIRDFNRFWITFGQGI
jgi:uncharacterized glyoxalase superfamily protein PhnB